MLQAPDGSPLACNVKGCGRLGEYLPVLLIPVGKDKFARVCLTTRICAGCRDKSTPVLLEMAKVQKAERIKQAFLMAGTLPPESLDGVSATWIRATSLEGRKALEAAARGRAQR